VRLVVNYWRNASRYRALIDLHCHILPGIDDGARDSEDSVAMARQAQADGIEAVCATPHIRDDHDVRLDELAARTRALEELVSAEELEVRVLPGGEVAQARAQRLTPAELRLATLGGAGRWLLLEPAPGPLSADLADTVRRLAAQGLQAIVAHPERHADAAFEERLAELVEMGCLVQWTAAFVADAAAGARALELARRGLVHVLGTDAHSSHAGRPVHLSAGFARLASVCSAERVAWMAETAPRAIVRGDPAPPPPP
jgi:protein-tyrosine phosphatase